MKDKLLTISLGLISSTVLSSCGVTVGQTNAISSATHTITAQFVDSEVSGLHYKSLSFNGDTDLNGRFPCNIDEEVNFSMGQLDMGNSICQRVITPQTLAAVIEQTLVPQTTTSASGTVTNNGSRIVTTIKSTSKPDAPEVVNRVRLLMSMDVDSDPSNGIQLPPVSQLNNININNIDFKITANFETAATSLLQKIPQLANRSLMGFSQASAHFNQTVTLDIPAVVSSPRNASSGPAVEIGQFYDSATGRFDEAGLEKLQPNFDIQHEGGI